MKIGSLVECVSLGGDSRSKTELNKLTAKLCKSAGYIWPTIKNIYTIRGFTPDGEGVYLEEIVNPQMNTTLGCIEVGFAFSFFREIQPPMDLSELMKEVESLELQTA